MAKYKTPNSDVDHLSTKHQIETKHQIDMDKTYQHHCNKQEHNMSKESIKNQSKQVSKYLIHERTRV